MDAVAELAMKAGCKLTICPQAENRNDRWIQVPRHWAVPSQDAGPEGRRACPHGVGRKVTGAPRRTWALGRSPWPLLSLILDLGLTPCLQNFLETQEHIDARFNTHLPPGSRLGTVLATHALPLATWTRGPRGIASHLRRFRWPP